MTAQPVAPEQGRFSALMAEEIRAQAARQGVSMSELARRIGGTHNWVHRRVSVHAVVDLTHEDTQAMAEALNVSIQGLYAAVLPRLDSNQQPSDYRKHRHLWAVA